MKLLIEYLEKKKKGTETIYSRPKLDTWTKGAEGGMVNQSPGEKEKGGGGGRGVR